MDGRSFVNLDPDTFKEATVILDVDGTLVADRTKHMDTRTKETLRKLASVAQVYLCSNARSVERLQEFAGLTGAYYLDTPYQKPDSRVVETIPQEEQRMFVVIGDKFLTDGLLAHRLGARFVKVERIHYRHERLAVHLAYAIDALLGRALFYTARFFSLA